MISSGWGKSDDVAKQEDKINYGHVCDVVQKCYQGMKDFREERLNVTRQIAGNRYSKNAADKKIFVNLVQLFINIVGPKLIDKNPRQLLSTDATADEPVVKTMQQWGNDEYESMNLDIILQRLVLDGFSCIGIAKIGLATPADTASAVGNLESGSPFVLRVDLDDFVFDTNAHDFESAAFFGNRYRASKKVIEESELYDAEARKNLSVSLNVRHNMDGGEKVGSIGRTNVSGNYEDFEEMVDLWEIYDTRRRKIYTFTDDDMSGPTGFNKGSDIIPLRVVDWIGPDTGPYVILAFNLVPGNPFPKGPLQDVVDLHEAANNVYRKLVRQAHDAKDIIMYRGNNPEDATNIQKTPDGGFAPVDDPKSVAAVSMGGPNEKLYKFLLELIQRFSWASGNLETIGGLSPQAHTLGQEEILQQQSSGPLSLMQKTMKIFTSRVMHNLNWFWWHGQQSMTIKHVVEGAPIRPIRQTVHPWDHKDKNAMRRTGPMPRVKIDPYSMRHTTPEQRAADLQGMVTQVIIPLMQLAKAEGLVFDFKEFLTTMGMLKDMPDLKRIMKLSDMPTPGDESDQGEQGADPGKPAETTRNYVRRSMGAASPQNQNMLRDNALSAGAANQEANGRVQFQ